MNPKSSSKKSTINKGQKNTRSNKGNASVSLMKEKSYSNPKIKTEKGLFRVTKREFITDILPTQGFIPIKFEINPGLGASFPWLSGIAMSFDKYKINKFRVCYEPSQSTFIQGMIMMAPEFDVADAIPTSKRDLLEMVYSVRGTVWEPFHMDLPAKSFMNQKFYYTRDGAVNSDLKFYDPMYITVATDNNSDLAYLGELWFEYDIEFYEPQTVNLTSLEQNRSRGFVFETGVSNIHPLGTSAQFRNDLAGTADITCRVDLSTFTFNQPFEGICVFVNDCTDWGLQTHIGEEPFASNTTNVTLGTIWAVGGAGDGPSEDPDYSMFVIGIKADAGGTWQHVNTGAYFEDPSEVMIWRKVVFYSGVMLNAP